ncbi:hypothetical protein [Paenibacillus sp. OV219]|uniref:hypothetical protein n=1 Tax=Paenibacillus sp. OV219 TaxID=1884377 RepID=UPI0008ABE7F8|nr:hypothetical protein [Paenibacillus sp. OV219]SEN09367.1 hypothetical protein SAMN05518847_102144 [Paenibacillus sp. OV219]
MRSLIELLFSNIYIVVIFVGFLLTMINKARGKQNSPNRMPTFGGEPSKRQQQEHPPAPTRDAHTPQLARRQEQPTRSEQQRPVKQPVAAMPAPVYTTQMKPRGDMIPSQPETEPGTLQRALAAERPAAVAVGGRPTAAARQPAEVPQRAQGSTAFRTPQGEELRRAFVMAEVLGPPRSKRTLRRM